MISFRLRSLALALVAVLCASTAGANTAPEQQEHAAARALKAQIEEQFQKSMLAAVNAERAKQGLSPFCTNKKLQAAAQLHSEDQAKNNFMDHTGSSGSTMADRISAQNFDWSGIAENVAAGQTDVTSVMQSWMGSDGHRKNILGNYKFFGTGYAYSASSTYKHYWTQDFATGNGEACDGDAPAPAPTTSAPPATSKPVYTPAPPAATPAPPAATTQPPVDQRPRPTTTSQPPIHQRPRPRPRATATPTSSPTITPTVAPTAAPTSKPSRRPKTDCKPIY